MRQPKSSEILMGAWYRIRDGRDRYVCWALDAAFLQPFGWDRVDRIKVRVMSEIPGANTLERYVHNAQRVADLKHLLPFPLANIYHAPTEQLAEEAETYMRELRLEWLSSLINDYRSKGD